MNYSHFLVLLSSLFTTLLIVISSPEVSSTNSFSGVLYPDVSKLAAGYGASWLISTRRFRKAEIDVRGVLNLEGATFAIIRFGCPGCENLMPKDYFDYFVEHLSSYSNQIPTANHMLFEEKIAQLQRLIVRFEDDQKFHARYLTHSPPLPPRPLRSVASLPSSIKPIPHPYHHYSVSGLSQDHPKQNYLQTKVSRTLACMVYSSIPFSTDINAKNQARIRKYFFQVTFWSTFYYFPNIVVFVASEKDYQDVQRMHLPITTLIRFQDVPVNELNQTVTLPKLGLLYIIQKFQAAQHPHFADFPVDSIQEYITLKQKHLIPSNTIDDQINYKEIDYLFYTESDQRIHMRYLEEFYELIDLNGGGYGLFPHRFQTLPLAQELSASVQYEFPPKHQFNNPKAQIISKKEDLYSASGSCCDYGNYDVVYPCYDVYGRLRSDHLWYYCLPYGIRNITQWLKFTDDGFTTPVVTAHRTRCLYSPDKLSCDAVRQLAYNEQGMSQPNDFCQSLGHARTIEGIDKDYQVCRKIPLTTRLGPYNATDEAFRTARQKHRLSSSKSFDGPRVERKGLTNSFGTNDFSNSVEELIQAEKQLYSLRKDAKILQKRINRLRHQVATSTLPSSMISDGNDGN